MKCNEDGVSSGFDLHGRAYLKELASFGSTFRGVLSRTSKTKKTNV